MGKIIKDHIFISVNKDNLYQGLNNLNDEYKYVGFDLQIHSVEENYILFKLNFYSGVEFDVPTFE